MPKKQMIAFSTFTISTAIFLNAILGSCGEAKTPAVVASIRSFNDTDYLAPGRGAQQWHDRNDVVTGSNGKTWVSKDVYWRMTWNAFEKAKDQYDFSLLDTLLNDCIRKKQKLSFGVMTCYPDGSGRNGMVDFDGGSSAYPQYLHQLMQAENAKDWKTDGNGPSAKGSWVPNWNSESYLTRLTALNKAINQHLQTASYNNVPYKHVISMIDVRGYGSWGEWHSANIATDVSRYPSGTLAKSASLKRIIDSYTNGFPDFQLVVMTGTFDADQLRNTKNPPDVGYYALTTRNKHGLLGWRRDSWGATDNYLHDYLENNRRSFNGLVLRDSIMERWKQAPIVGEAPGWLPPGNDCAYEELKDQVAYYHVSSLGNGNFGVTINDCVSANIRKAFAVSGYRLVIEKKSIPNIADAGSSVPISLSWINQGVAPLYDSWDVYIELKDSKNKTVAGIKSKFQPRLFLPADDATEVKDNFTIPELPKGQYELSLTIKDPSGYLDPLPLYMPNVNEDGSYALGKLEIKSKKN